MIGDAQIKLINHLTKKLRAILENKNNASGELKQGKSLYERYGVTRQLVGRGAYGVIKVIYPHSYSGVPGNVSDLSQQLFVVKELQRKRAKEESNTKFIERILSEFVIASTLNYRHIVETIDLMINPQDFKISQIMQCSQGGDLFSYLTSGIDINSKSISYMSLYEVDCFIKQIAKGLKYMHVHGVSHCDLKLENILVTYKQANLSSAKAKIILKLTDFGKSFVFRTKFDTTEQLIPTSQGIIGSLAYISPEEHIKNITFSSIKKDCWALGIIILALLNIRRHYYTGFQSQQNIALRYIETTEDDSDVSGNDSCTSGSSSQYGPGYLWHTTEPKHHHHLSPKREYRDRVFNEYVSKRMIGEYDDTTKEWLIKRPGKFRPIDEICQLLNPEGHVVRDLDELGCELNELRVLVLYKLLDIDPTTRMTVNQFLGTDWMESTEDCI